MKYLGFALYDNTDDPSTIGSFMCTCLCSFTKLTLS